MECIGYDTSTNISCDKQSEKHVYYMRRCEEENEQARDELTASVEARDNLHDLVHDGIETRGDAGRDYEEHTEGNDSRVRNVPHESSVVEVEVVLNVIRFHHLRHPRRRVSRRRTSLSRRCLA